MIKDVFKYLVYGTQKNLDQFFELAQEKGFLEFIPFDTKNKVLMPASLTQLSEAMKILKTHTAAASFKGEIQEDVIVQVAEDVVHCKVRLEKLYEEKKYFILEAARIAPLGEFSMSDILAIENQTQRKIQFFCMKVSHRHHLSSSDSLFFLRTENDLDYFMSISKESIYPPNMIEIRVDLSLEEIQTRLSLILDQILHIENQLKKYTIYLDAIKQVFIEKLNIFSLASAKTHVLCPLKAPFFIAKVWVPSSKVKEFHDLIEETDICGEQIALDSADKAPTYLENKGLDLIGEDIIKIYDTPSIRDQDPSRWVLSFFALFFAIIVGDAGYGLLFLIVTLYCKRKYAHPSRELLRSFKLMMIVSVACMIWGVATCSYFGIQFAPSSSFMKIAPIQALVVKKADFHLKQKDDVYTLWSKKFPEITKASSGRQALEKACIVGKKETSYPMLSEFFGNIILELSLVLGIFHLSTAFLKNIKKHVAGLGWVLFIIGGYFFFPSLLNATTIVQFTNLISTHTANMLGLECMWLGVGFAVIASLIQYGVKGLAEVMHIIQIIADVLSYLRLYALSLAGAIMANTFNKEGTTVGVLIGFIIILAGHSVNITLALMGGIIHGLRLNFLEWYRYCFEGNGKLFNPLKKLKIKG